MSEGRIRQIGTQQDLYERPADRFVADFVGRSTFLEGSVAAPGRFTSAGGLSIACAADTIGPATLALRPERIAILGSEPPPENVFEGRVEFISISARSSTSMSRSMRRTGPSCRCRTGPTGRRRRWEKA